jgi:hypothetical protein
VAARVEDPLEVEIGDVANPAALDKLNALHGKLVRECSMSYWCGARLRENVSPLLGAVTGTIARPSAGRLLLLREYKDEEAQAAAELKTILSAIKKLEFTDRPFNAFLQNPLFWQVCIFFAKQRCLVLYCPGTVRRGTG